MNSTPKQNAGGERRQERERGSNERGGRRSGRPRGEKK